MNEIFADEQDATYILLNDNANNPVKYFSNGTMDTLDLNNLEIAMFVGCKTGHGGLDEANLVSQALYQGATAALGFQENINCNEANEWLKRLFDLLISGVTLRNACLQLHTDGNWQYTTMASYVICGNSVITLPRG